jgi:hypothetical protein
MKKWVWTLSLALVVWAVGLKFSPEETVIGSFRQIRFEVVSLLFGGFIGLMFGLVTTKGEGIAEERRKVLYSALGCCSIGFLLTWGASLSSVVIGSMLGMAVGLAIGGANYIAHRRLGTPGGRPTH